MTAGDAENFRLYLVGQDLAPTTVHKRLQFARQFFRSACRHKLMAENPFAEVRSSPGNDSDRQRFITQDETLLMLDIDCHASGTLEGATQFAEHLKQHFFPNLYYETSTHGNGIQGFVVVDRSFRSDCAVQGDARRGREVAQVSLLLSFRGLSGIMALIPR